MMAQSVVEVLILSNTSVFMYFTHDPDYDIPQNIKCKMPFVSFSFNGRTQTKRDCNVF